MRVRVHRQTLYLLAILFITLILSVGCGQNSAPRTLQPGESPEGSAAFQSLNGNWTSPCLAEDTHFQTSILGFGKAGFVQSKTVFENSDCSTPSYSIKVIGRYQANDSDQRRGDIELDLIVDNVDIALHKQDLVDSATTNGSIHHGGGIWKLNENHRVTGLSVIHETSSSRRYTSKSLVSFAWARVSEQRETLLLSEWYDSLGIQPAEPSDFEKANRNAINLKLSFDRE